MTVRTPCARSASRRTWLMIGVSLATLGGSLAGSPAIAQTAAGILAARAANPGATTRAPGFAPFRSATAQQALLRQASTLSRTQQIRSYIMAAQAAAVAANRGPVSDGLSANGLDPTDAIREAVAAAKAGDTARAQQLLVSAHAANDPTGLATWEGAGLPTQTVADGKTTVTIDQTQQRALLSWNSFNVGKDTTLQFNQKADGVAQPGWVAVNRVTNSVAPSQILGNLKADGTVVVINQRGVIFGKGAQVDTNSLLASSLELGHGAKLAASAANGVEPTTIKDRNTSYLETGLFGPANETANGAALLVSAQTEKSGTTVRFADDIEGEVVVDAGANLQSGTGGFVMLTAPRIAVAGDISAVEGQVSLQAGRAVSFVQSTGADSDIDPDVRGFKLNSFDYANSDRPEPRPPQPGDGEILIAGIIESRRGYLSLGAGVFGSVEQNGLLTTTTSVSRNGKISITAGRVVLGGGSQPAAIEMLADDNGETIPQGTANEPAGFKASQLEIGAQPQLLALPVGGLLPTDFSMGAHAVILAPGADVAVGTTDVQGLSASGFLDVLPGRIDIASGAVIDVSGLKDVQLAASRNSLEITPVKRNELRDTPNYREVALDGNFSLNGATLYVDPRVSGVRADGVAWIGSPLIEAGSLASQIPVTAEEFMTKGGTVRLETSAPTSRAQAGIAVDAAPSIQIGRAATIDFSGGWVSYAPGPVRTSRLITNDGRIVDIAEANPNDVYVGVAEGYSDVLPRLGIVRQFYSAIGGLQQIEPGYDEGRDAGSLTIVAPAVTNDGTFFGNAFPGARQVAQGDRPSLASALAGDSRRLQRLTTELPSGGALSFDTWGDILVYHGERGKTEANRAELLLDDAMLSDAGLSALSLKAPGRVTFADERPDTLQPDGALTITGRTDVRLAPGGVLSVEAGRTIRFDGDVTVSSGVIDAKTVFPPLTLISSPFNGSVFRTGLYGEGEGDDIAQVYASDPGALTPFDIIVTGQLSAAGLWTNDLKGPAPAGGAFRDGGSISLTVAPNLIAAVGSSLETATQAVDLSGSIRIDGRLNVMSGGWVTPTGELKLDGVGGDVALINQTTYASTQLTTSGRILPGGVDTGIRSDMPLGGASQSVDFTPLPSTSTAAAVLPNLVPDPRSTVYIADGAITAFGFAGGGTFSLVAPDVSFGSDNRAGSTHIGFDVFKATGFGTLDLSTYRSRIVDDIFTNARAGKSAFLETTNFVVGAGETFDLTQWMLPSLPNSDQVRLLRALETGADLSAQHLLAPTPMASAWDQKAAHLVLGGLTELDVLAGGRIVGAPEASLTVSKLYNGGEIVLHGGSIHQRNDLPSNLVVGGLGVRDVELGGAGLAEAFGGDVDDRGRFDETAINAAGITDPAATTRVITNQELVSRDGADRLIYFLGRLDAPEGVVLADGSTTDLSGVALLDPRAPRTASAGQVRRGRVLDGGRLSLDSGVLSNRRLTFAGATASASNARTLIREDGAVLNISGASAIVDQATGMGRYARYLEWSAAGSVSALGGGSLGSTPIQAFGGASAAEGGVLEWLAPTVGSDDAETLDYLGADMITASGFDTLVARGSLTLDGDFSLSLRKALMVTSQDPTGVPQDRDAQVSIRATEGTYATLRAGYVRFASRLGGAAMSSQTEGDARVAFVSGAQGIDVVGGIGFDRSIEALSLSTPGDIRLTGVNDAPIAGSKLDVAYNGLLLAGGDMRLDARRTYATTGTGNLQALLEGRPASLSRPYDIAVVGDHSITFGDSFLDPDIGAPLSAGTHLRVLAPRIVQNGYLAAPLGLLELGANTRQSPASGVFIDPTESLTFGARSVTTVSAAGLEIPYGATTDLIEYFFPTVPTPITRLPTGQLNFSAESIVERAGALIDGRGGGDVFAYEFQSGVGGSRDVLDRTNRDAFSANGYDPATGVGYQYPDQRQVFALVPVDQAGRIAPFDPIYSADYGAAGPVDLYGASAGKTVVLDGGQGVPAGEYLLLPAKYAMSIPGALRLVENTEAEAPPPGASTRLLDGSVIVGGSFAYGDTGIAESTRRSFTVQSKDVFTRYSRIETTSGTDYLLGNAGEGTRPRLPIDAARVILAPLSELRLAGAFDTAAAEGGQTGQVDILARDIVIGQDGSEVDDGVLLIAENTLNKLGAASLLIGGQRSETADGVASLTVSARSIDVRPEVSLRAAELLLAVGGVGSTLTIGDGADLSAMGELGAQPTSDYAVSTGGSLLRLASGPERLVNRTGAGQSTIEIGRASISGHAFAIDTSGGFLIDGAARISASQIALSADGIRFEDLDDPTANVIDAALERQLAAAERLTIRSPSAVRFAAGVHRFNDLVLDAAALAATDGANPQSDLSIVARDVRLLNASGAADGCAVADACAGAADLRIDARTLAFGTNSVRAAGFSGDVVLSASAGIYVEDKGSFDAGDADLALNTPFVAERSVKADPRDQAARPDYTFLTTGAVVVQGPQAGSETPRPDGELAPGARIAFGTIDAPVASASVVGAMIRATAGIVDIQAEGDIALRGATLSAPGYERTFGDEADPVVVSAGGGILNLLSRSGSIDADAASTLVSDSGVGSAGALNLLAGNGQVSLSAAVNPDAKGERQGDFTLDAGASSFDFAGFITRYGQLFGGDVAVRTGFGDLSLDAGQTLKAKSVSLTADGGAITIAGALDTSGVDVTGLSADAARDAAVDGGDIALWGREGVTLTATAKLDTHTTGYADTDSRAASAGDVILGVDSQTAAITIAPGAVIDVGARRTQLAQASGESGGRLIPQTLTDPLTGNAMTVYRYAEPDTGGTVRLRAPVLGAAEDKVAVSLGGAIQGADSIQLEAFKRYDLDALADSGLYSGVVRDADGAILLDMAAGSAAGGLFNPFTEDFQLADGGSSVVRFVQGLDLSTVDGSSLDGVRIRPGVELSASGDIQTTTQWNLAAATFSPEQLQAAVDAGVLEVIPELSTDTDAAYRVVAGREGDLLDRFATFLYRTGGSARGEAPVVTLRAGGDLIVGRSISDGFFTFRDKSDPAYLNWQMGGGDRTYAPAIQLTCGTATGSCASIVSYQDGVARNPGASGTLTIALGTQQATPGDLQGAEPYVNSPLSLTGNGAAGGGGDRDSLGFGELFPLLDGDVAMHSSDLRLVAGAGSELSVDPLRVDRAQDADVVLAGEYSYRVTATGTVAYHGPLQFRLQRSGTTAPQINFDVGETLDLAETTAGLDQLKDDAYTQLNWGSTSGLGADARAAALAYFAGKEYRLVGSATAPSGVIAPLNEILGFLQAFEPTYQAGLADGRAGYTANRTPPLLRYGNANQQASPTAPNQAWVRTYVRSGDGDIDVAASRDVDLRGAPDLQNRDITTYRRTDLTATATPNYAASGGSLPFSAAAIYTAGVRVAPAPVTARVVGGDLVSITPDSPYLTASPERVDFIPSPKGLTDASPVLAHGGGDVSLAAGRDVLARRDVWTERFGGSGANYTATGGGGISTGGPAGWDSQRWRIGAVGDDTEIALIPRYFTSGVGALGGGDITIDAGRDVTELTVALDNSVTTTVADIGETMLSFGHGDLSLDTGRDLLAARIDIASGHAGVTVGRDIGAFGLEPIVAGFGETVPPQYSRIRLADAVVDVSVRGAATLASVSALGVNDAAAQSVASAGFFSPTASFAISANETVEIAPARSDPNGNAWDYGQQPLELSAQSTASLYIQVLPPSLEMTSLAGRVVLPEGARQLLYPSPIGQLRLFSDGDVRNLSIAMSDMDPALLGAFVFQRNLAPYQFPYVLGGATDAQLRSQHSRFLTHLADDEPVRIYSNGDITTTAIFLPKQARISAGGDIVDMFFNGQNLRPDDITRIRAGGDIKGSIGQVAALPYVRSNNFILGGPGAFIVEAGRNLGPFVTSANMVGFDGVTYSFGGGIRTIGNDYNPWLAGEGADLSVRFGMAAGADYDRLRDTYLDPANLDQLDGDLFVQVTDSFGNRSPDRTKPVYAPLLAEWLRENDPADFARIFEGETFPTGEAGRAALAEAAYGRMAELYAAFSALDPLRQQGFLVDTLYFNELAASADPDGPSYQQYVRGYRAVEALFPAERGYTDNLAPYTVDPSTVSADHPLGEPVRNIVDGQPQVAERVITGNVDLRLATVQTARGGAITILGPGGDVIAGSVVRTADQAARRGVAFSRPGVLPLTTLESGQLDAQGSNFASVPLGYEGVLTLRGGQIQSFTDGDFILNQSRLFTQQNGDILMWSSNGDLNAGQGPKSASNFPPVTVRLNENGLAEVNSAGSVAGAGIGAFQRTPLDPPSDVVLIAPVGEVDAGDAGVRASGNIVVAAARVANADNFKAAGEITGVPSGAVTAQVATPADATSAMAAQATQAATGADQADRRSLITVQVLGPAADGKCDPSNPDDPDCAAPSAGERR